MQTALFALNLSQSPAIAVPGERIKPPADFPVHWPKAGDEIFHWTRDREHIPQPITPMYLSVVAPCAGEGRARTVERYAEALLGRDDRIINGYNYTRVLPFEGTPAEIDARARHNRAIMNEVCARLEETWQTEWKPVLEAHWRFWARFDLPSASLEALSAHLEETITRTTNMYEIHYLMGPPMWFALDEFERFYTDLFPGATALNAHRLLQGCDNKTLQIGRAIWELSRLAIRLPEVKKLIAGAPAHQIAIQLPQTAGGVTFIAALDAFLADFGRRSDLWDWGYPAWAEDTAPVFASLKSYIRQPDRDMLAALAQAAAERETAIATAREGLAGYPAAVRERFEILLRAAQSALVMSEDHTYYIDFNGLGWVRRVIGEFGRRVALAGCLACPDDIFYLTLGELREWIANPGLDLAVRAASRREEIERWSSYPAPVELGTRPLQPLTLYSADARRMARYLGAWVADEDAPVQSAEPGTLRGQAGSAGKACGRARVIPALADAHRLQPGEILVTTTTAPPWTPLFLTAGGLVTDAGGLLSHGAVVSREYRLPAVVGVSCATTAILDGQMIEVDGDNGIVRILEEL